MVETEEKIKKLNEVGYTVPFDVERTLGDLKFFEAVANNEFKLETDDEGVEKLKNTDVVLSYTVVLFSSVTQSKVLVEVKADFDEKQFPYMSDVKLTGIPTASFWVASDSFEIGGQRRYNNANGLKLKAGGLVLVKETKVSTGSGVKSAISDSKAKE